MSLNDDEIFKTLAPKHASSPMTGIKKWDNPENKFCVFEIHYTADPEKRSSDWKNKLKPSMPIAKWNQEYEILWDSFSGMPVYSDFVESVHTTRKGLSPQIGLPLLRGWDFGLTPACVIAQLQGDTLCILNEFVELNMGADKFSDKVLTKCRLLYPQWAQGGKDWLDYVDPAGAARDQSNEGTCVKILDGKGLTCIPGAISFEERRNAVNYYLVHRSSAGACFMLDALNCPTLLRGFLGGYRYPEGSIDREARSVKPIKDEHSHPHDALQYLCTGIIMKKRQKFTRIPRLAYSWSNLREMRFRR